MTWERFKIIPQRFLGIDIGTSAIKVVEVSRWRERRKLENYGQVAASALYKRPFRTFEESTLALSNENIARAIKAIIEEADIKTRQVTFSIPDFSSFFTTFKLPAMSKEELSQAVLYEAKRHVPVPFGEVTLDWQIIESIPSKEKKTKTEILLVAVPNEVIYQYQAIAKASNLELLALEAEVFGLIRSLVGEESPQPLALIDLGAHTTTCSILENKALHTSHSFDLSGNELTQVLSKGLGVDYTKAEKLKKKYGILNNQKVEEKKGQQIREILLPLIDIMLREINRVCQDFSKSEGKEIKKFILAGGTALLPGLKEYFYDSFKKEVEIADPFSNMFYPPILEKTLKKMGPSFAIVVGMALRALE
jgi:type IV pilus assembly protein PilM